MIAGSLFQSTLLLRYILDGIGLSFEFSKELTVSELFIHNTTRGLKASDAFNFYFNYLINI